MLSNVERYRVRWKLFSDFARRVHHAGALLYVVEVATGNREFAVTEPNNPRHLQLRSTSDIWHKEAALNALVAARLPQSWKYLCWADTDISWARDDWADEILQLLQRYAIVQPWSQALDLDAKHHVMSTMWSYAYCWTHGFPRKNTPPTYYHEGKKVVHFHPGFVWACTREAFDTFGRLMDFPILGSADFLMACGITGDVNDALHLPYNPRYKEMILKWQTDAAGLNKNFGFMDGVILHHWHGGKKQRRYRDRTDILIDNDFNPDTDLKRDWQGLYALTGNKTSLRDQIRAYMAQRNEDSVEVENDPWADTMLLKR